MIAVDSSAIVAIMLREPDAPRFAAMLAAEDTVVAPPTLIETHIVLVNRGVPNARALLDHTITGTRTEVIAFTETMAHVANAAFLRYGKGRHPARLNFGDCMAYALAKTLDVALLYKGEDFARTDIRSALA